MLMLVLVLVLLRLLGLGGALVIFGALIPQGRFSLVGMKNASYLHAKCREICVRFTLRP
jgi:hypothetical protein